MIPWSLAVANLFRHPMRTTLTFASLVVAFLLFMVLNAIATAFSGGGSLEGAKRLIVDAKYSVTDNLPVSYLQQIRALDGVDEAVGVNWFGGYYQDPKTTFTTLSVDPLPYFSIYSDYDISPQTLEKFSTIRIAALASQALADKFGWSVGDHVVLRGDIWPKEDGSWNWEFEFVGTFSGSGDQISESLFLVRRDYFDDAVADWAKNKIGFIALKTQQAPQPEQVAAEIDARYENSTDPTRTTSEDEYTRQFVSQLGDIGLISSIILGAVFFTILLLTGNTASQTFRERVPELAAMKTLGFTDKSVACLVLFEAVLLCVAGGGTGIVLALVLEPTFNGLFGSILGNFTMDIKTIGIAIGLSIAIGLLIGVQPAWSAQRLTIVDALRQR